mmetsp:Transcript_126015/g.368202  ORF Transcript_126015/g.368202 Transcript_126015/m.368202 type:complete len:488 (+) Transcript_126015:90-1553(+)
MKPRSLVFHEGDEKVKPLSNSELLSRLAVVGFPAYPLECGGRVLGLTSAALVGQHGDTTALAAIALGNALTKVTGSYVIYGLSTGVTTKSSQDWGAGNYHAIGITLQRGILILMVLVNLPVAALWLSSRWVLEATGQHPDVARLVGLFALVRLPGLPFMTVNQVLTQTLCSMSNLYIKLATGVFIGGLNVVLSFLLIPYLGFIGAPLSATICDIAENTGLTLMTMNDKEFRKCWRGFKYEAWQDWGSLLRVSCPACVLFGVESMSWDVNNFVAGFISPLAQATQAVAPQIADLQYSTGLSLGTAAVTVIGNLFGEGQTNAARRSVFLIAALCCFLMALQVTVFAVLRTKVAGLFTSDSSMLDGIVDLLPITLLFSFLDGHQAALTGVIQAAGKQYLVAPLVLVCYWIVGIPLGLVLTWGCFGLPSLGLKGLWMGMVVGVAGHLLCVAVAVACLDWHEITAEVQERTHQEHGDKGQEPLVAKGMASGI